MAGIPPITPQDVRATIESLRSLGIPKNRRSTKFCLVARRDHFPPKYVLALAAKRSLGRELEPSEFSGGSQTNQLLKHLGFQVRACGCGGAIASQVASRPIGGASTPIGPHAHARRTGTKASADANASTVRIVVDGRPPGDAKSAERMLLAAFKTWPKRVKAKFAITPGGFVESRWPTGLSVSLGWDSRSRDFAPLIGEAEAKLKDVATPRVFDAAEGRTEILTLGIDLTDGPGNAHAELVALYDISTRQLIRWTGKSYPISSQEHTLYHVTDLDSHFIELAGERVLVLGCHDLNMFSPRGRANQLAHSPRRKRCNGLRSRTAKFKPTVVLQHPHSTDTHRIWSMPWSSHIKATPSIKSWASGIGYHNWHEPPRMELARVLETTKSADVLDVMVKP